GRASPMRWRVVAASSSWRRGIPFARRFESVSKRSGRLAVEARVRATPSGHSGSDLEMLLAYPHVGGEVGGRAFEDDAPVAHHVHPVRDLERDGQLLLHEQDRGAGGSGLV